MPQSNSHSAPPPFRPQLMGCVARDKGFARMLEGVNLHTLYSFATMTYRALLAERCDHRLCALFDEIVYDESEHFRLIGALIFALGGNPSIRAQLQVARLEPNDGQDAPPERLASQLIMQTLEEKKRSINRLQTLMGRSRDRIVRSILAYLIADEERHMEMLKKQ